MSPRPAHAGRSSRALPESCCCFCSSMDSTLHSLILVCGFILRIYKVRAQNEEMGSECWAQAWPPLRADHSWLQRPAPVWTSRPADAEDQVSSQALDRRGRPGLICSQQACVGGTPQLVVLLREEGGGWTEGATAGEVASGHQAALQVLLM